MPDFYLKIENNKEKLLNSHTLRVKVEDYKYLETGINNSRRNKT